MKTLYIKQKMFALKEQYYVKDAAQNPIYTVEGSFIKLPKSFVISNNEGTEVAVITKKTISLLPKFTIDLNGFLPIVLKSHFKWLNSKYTVDTTEFEMIGEWADFNFKVIKNGEIIGEVQPVIFSLADAYEIRIHDEAFEKLLVSLTVAIDCVRDGHSIIKDSTLLFD